MSKTIAYYHPLNLSFKSAQTIQIIRDYTSLSNLGYKIILYGTFANELELLEIKKYTQNNAIKIIAFRQNFFGKILSKSFFFKECILEKPMLIITRSFSKVFTLYYLKLLFKFKILHELHEEAFPFLVKEKKTKKQFLISFEKIDLLLFTNYSQILLFKEHFHVEPQKPYIVLPNGVEAKKFNICSRSKNFILTYAGQFNEWKNVDLIFETLSLLDNRFSLRIIGGKSFEEGLLFIKSKTVKYGININRIDYKGFLLPDEIPNAISKSFALLLPLGENIQSKYLTSPMKLFEYMATSIPILTINFPSIASFVSEKEVFLAKNKADEWAKVIEKDLFDDTLVQTKVEAMRNLVKKYDYSNRSKQYDSFISKYFQKEKSQ